MIRKSQFQPQQQITNVNSIIWMMVLRDCKTDCLGPSKLKQTSFPQPKGDRAESSWATGQNAAEGRETGTELDTKRSPSPQFSYLKFFNHILMVVMWWWRMTVRVHMSRLEDNFQESILSLHHVDPKDQVIRLGSQRLTQ